MTEAAIGQVQKQDELLKGLAVYHDLTRESLSPELKIPQITPEQAAEHLLNLSSQYDFTLFEYFMTDRAGHKQDPQLSKKVFRQFDRFLCELSQKKPENLLLILCSDHGNCEDLSSKSHNRNSVPLLVLGAPPVPCDDLTSIQDLHDWIIELFNSPKNNKFI
jgi:phosphopentomutase